MRTAPLSKSDAMPQSRPKSIVNIADIELRSRPPQYLPKGAAAERYDMRSGLVSRQMGAAKLGFNITVIPPGKRAYPFHNHQINEEMFFIFEGAGSIRMGPYLDAPIDRTLQWTIYLVHDFYRRNG